MTGYSFFNFLVVVRGGRTIGTTAARRGERDIHFIMQKLQNVASINMDRRNTSKIFDTAVSSHEEVLQKGFPLPHWNPCTIQNKIKKKIRERKDIKITILGGSASSRTADDCTVSGTSFCRYSDVLQNIFWDFTTEAPTLAASINFTVSNMAHGSTDTMLNTLLLDNFVDPLDTDLIMWEFAINDHSRNATGLDFFFRRIHHLYATHGHSPPALLMIYLWDKNAAEKEASEIRTTGPGTGSYKKQMATIEHFQSLGGWNIQVITVGSAISKKDVAENKKLLWDDGHHPSCHGVKLIANMVAHALYTSLAAACFSDPDTSTPATPLLPSAPSEPTFKPFVFQNTTQISSLTAIEPNAGTSSIHFAPTIGLHGNTTTTRYAILGKTLPSRKDRKKYWHINQCFSNDEDEVLTFTVLNPNIRWLLLGFGNIHINRLSSDLVIRINDESFHLQNHDKGAPWGRYGYEHRRTYIDEWVKITPSLFNATSYKISICDQGNNTEPVLQFFLILTNDEEDSILGRL
jgi:hypothetical protein